MIDYYVRLVELPLAVEGVTVPNDDGSFDIYINSRLPEPQRDQVLAHELRHVELEHFYLDLPAELMERQADGENINVVLHPPEGMIPCFSSPDAFSHWFSTLCAQCHIDFDKLSR